MSHPQFDAFLARALENPETLAAFEAAEARDETVVCDGCGQDTPWIDWCDHGRITCTECANFAPCRHCKREARP